MMKLVRRVQNMRRADAPESGGYNCHIHNPRCSMYGIFTYIYPKNHPNVGKYTIHGASGNSKLHLESCLLGIKHGKSPIFMTWIFPLKNPPLNSRLITRGLSGRMEAVRVGKWWIGHIPAAIQHVLSRPNWPWRSSLGFQTVLSIIFAKFATAGNSGFCHLFKEKSTYQTYHFWPLRMSFFDPMIPSLQMLVSVSVKTCQTSNDDGASGRQACTMFHHVSWAIAHVSPQISCLPGKNEHSYGKSPCSIGKATIKKLVFQRYVSFPEGKSLSFQPFPWAKKQLTPWRFALGAPHHGTSLGSAPGSRPICVILVWGPYISMSLYIP